ncbi:YHYH protein [Tenacibaculum sp. M341]|nr:YHYH protein [Tenacibaculum sp. M341]
MLNKHTIMKYFIPTLMSISFLLTACGSDNTNTIVSDNTDDGDATTTPCTKIINVDTSRGDCNETLSFNPLFTMSSANDIRTIKTNNIPAHKVGKFGAGQGSLNPHAIAPLDITYNIDLTPATNTNFTSLLRDSGGIAYSFGVLLNGIELDPVAAEPWPHSDLKGADPNANWNWNLEALNTNLGLDCSNAHVQSTGQYHHHGSPTLYLESLNIDATTMTLIGYAADGFPIYYKYAYTDANNASSGTAIMTSSYRLKTGDRPGDGESEPCGAYTGVYTNDYEYVQGLGTLDEANGRTGVTPEYPSGTYYYVVTDEFPSIPRYFKGTPSQDFRIGG